MRLHHAVKPGCADLADRLDRNVAIPFGLKCPICDRRQKRLCAVDDFAQRDVGRLQFSDVAHYPQAPLSHQPGGAILMRLGNHITHERTNTEFGCSPSGLSMLLSRRNFRA
ncbi:hypothetical protein [Tardibacter chloracetimidivorans]|uniref:hypothetical protein n=1 Tax=Tardibacter chloracetimidivorans TaxID=1921510 RepID=UPI0013012010|nr:hypothetical protein [Tardibacter chloracetimidivorans]